jgi:hypothetical protein
LCDLRRAAAAVDAFLLKIAIEERLGWPVHVRSRLLFTLPAPLFRLSVPLLALRPRYAVQLISDGLTEGIKSALDLNGPESVYEALAAGTADIYPEVQLAQWTVVDAGGRLWFTA